MYYFPYLCVFKYCFEININSLSTKCSKIKSEYTRVQNKILEATI